MTTDLVADTLVRVGRQEAQSGQQLLCALGQCEVIMCSSHGEDPCLPCWWKGILHCTHVCRRQHPLSHLNSHINSYC